MSGGTVFLDIDGCIFKHKGSIFDQIDGNAELLPSVYEFFEYCVRNDIQIVLTTGRPESYRQATISQLLKHRLPYSVLLMGLSRGPRVLINDSKPDSNVDTVVGIQLDRNRGLEKALERLNEKYTRPDGIEIS